MLSIAVIGFAAITGGANPASASAEGFTFFGYITIYGHTIPGGYLDGTIDGSSLRVDDWKLGFETVGTICNWSEGVAFYDVNNHLYESHRLGVHYSCNPVGEDIWWASGHPYTHGHNYKSGRSCATLYSNGIRVDAICESIHP